MDSYYENIIINYIDSIDKIDQNIKNIIYSNAHSD